VGDWGGVPTPSPSRGWFALSFSWAREFFFVSFLVNVRCFLAIRAVRFLFPRFFGGGCSPLTKDFTGVLVLERGFLECLRRSI
jgi:hypothetical protein